MEEKAFLPWSEKRYKTRTSNEEYVISENPVKHQRLIVPCKRVSDQAINYLPRSLFIEEPPNLTPP